MLQTEDLKMDKTQFSPEELSIWKTGRQTHKLSILQDKNLETIAQRGPHFMLCLVHGQLSVWKEMGLVREGLSWNR